MKVLKKVIKCTFWILCVLVIGVLIYGTISQKNYDKKVESEFKPTGKIVELSNNKMHYQILGDGNFTFVLETGLGENTETWKKIKDSLAQNGRVFMYDRSGLGFSEPNNEARTTKQIASELHELLTKEKIAGPYILVGHSIGGAHIRYFAHLYPENVAGLFLIDPSHEKMIDNMPTPSIMEKFFNFSAVNMAWSGIPFYLLPNPPHPNYKTSISIKTYGREISAIDDSINQFRSEKPNLAQFPIYIISATAKDGQYKEENLNLMNELIEQSESEIKKHIIEDKPHHIHLTDPEIVLTELREFSSRIFYKTTAANNVYN